MYNTTAIANQIVTSYHDDELKRKLAIKSSIKTYVINTLLAVSTCIVYLLFHQFKTPYEFEDVLIIGIGIWTIPGTFICLIMVSGGVGRYYNSAGVRKYPLICIILNLLSIIDMFIIFTWAIIPFKYCAETDTLEMSFGILLIISPAIFIIMILVILIKGKIITPRNFEYTPISTIDFNLKYSGINPYKVPYDVRTIYYQKLSINEWKEIGNAVKQFGYDIFGG